ncbi:type II toxin-antitoxin system HipA family toxin [Catenovulum agarivorans]|uniref:type II toxin-antitoxin system HipA family toxin n=1 Tax=Catenovulum agarivorans TaxID=1172192 RepID=UPI001ED96FFE|nr:type II toxin-antitoxin system HipA family toxin [Catenovulum agarivorans]
MNGILVGELHYRQGSLSFQYDESWLKRAGSRALSQSLPMGAPLNNQAVEAYFDNLLPDNINIRRNIVTRLGANSTSTFDLLESIGRDCVGAVALSQSPPSGHLPQLELSPCNENAIATLLKNTRVSNTLGMQDNEDFRISLAGAQEKTALTWWNNQWHKPLGKTPTTHILKPPIQHHSGMNIDLTSSVDNEWFCLQFLNELDIPAAKASIEQFEDERVLVVERFDRKLANNAIIRLPQEDFCQALGRLSDNKYEEHGGPSAHDIMELLSLSLNPINDRTLFMKIQVLFWLLAGIDGHAKNFSIFLQAKGFCLTPFYDVMSAYPYFGQGNIQPQKIKMAMKVHSKNTHYRWSRILARHWLNHANYLSFPENDMKAILVELCETVPDALIRASDSASNLFSHQVGEAITKGTNQCLEKLKRQLSAL